MTEPVWLDGTQDLPPQPMLPDPLAGLLTGEVLPGAPPVPVVEVVQPPAPRAVVPAIGEVFAEPPRQPRKKQRRGKRPANVPATRYPPQPPQGWQPVNLPAGGSGQPVRQPVNVPAAGYRPRPQVPARPANSGSAKVIAWIVVLFILFLIARAVISGIAGQ